MDSAWVAVWQRLLIGPEKSAASLPRLQLRIPPCTCDETQKHGLIEWEIQPPDNHMAPYPRACCGIIFPDQRE
jgi:hypothetical protein